MARIEGSEGTKQQICAISGIMWIDTVRHWFDDYVDGFRHAGELHELLELKRAHSLRVAVNTRKIASALGWSARDVDLAEVGGLLHDIGRFPQYRDHRTFADAQSVDHGDLGADILARDFPWTQVTLLERQALELAVRHHNARRIPAPLPAHALPLLKALRDGDKLDVLAVVRQWTEAGQIQELFPHLPTTGPLSPTLLRRVAQGQHAPYAEVRSMADCHLFQLGWVYDLSYAPSHRMLVSTGLLDWLLSRLPPGEEVAPLLAAAESHVRTSAARQPSAAGTPVP